MLVFCIGLAVALCGFAYVFVLKLVKFMSELAVLDDVDAVLKVLSLIDYSLVAGLIVMVMMATFSSFIEGNEQAQGGSWLSGVSFGSLKLKLAATIAAIGGINLLETLFETGTLHVTNTLLNLGIEIVLLAVVLVFAHVEQSHGKAGH